jgi:hypothetical protein
LATTQIYAKTFRGRFEALAARTQSQGRFVSHTEPNVNPVRHARTLLAAVRETPMIRSTPKAEVERTWDAITVALEREGVLPKLARRVGMQLVLKIDVGVLEGPDTWRAIGAQLVHETNRLRSELGLVDRQIVVALPKLAGADIKALLDSLVQREPAVARTILNAALDASVPREAAERYLEEYRRVVASLSRVEPNLARTMANATFMARRPTLKAKRHLERFGELVTEFGNSEAPIRTLAREACRAPGPRAAGRKFIKDRRTVIGRLTSRNADVTVARTIASIACLSADPIAKGDELYGNFEAALKITNAVHPRAARTIALSACRSATPIEAARRYIDNYERIVRMVSRIDAGHAHDVAAQAFRSDEPLRWARQYLEERRRGTTAKT